MRVETTGTGNVYLRSWIGSNFNMQTDTWTTADYDAVLAYRTLFGIDFTSDDITYNFNKYVYPSSVDITEQNVYKNLSKYGFNVQQVHVQRTSGSSLLLFIPAHMNPDIGLRAVGSRNINIPNITMAFIPLVFTNPAQAIAPFPLSLH